MINDAPTKLIPAEWELWSRIANRAKALFPHNADVIYTLTVWSYASSRPRYPRIKLKEEQHFFFHSLADAEKQISFTNKQRKAPGKVHPGHSDHCTKPYCFIVDEIPVGVPRHLLHEAQAWWRYDGNGKLIVSSLVSEIEDEGGCLEPFFGRPPEMCPARTGDIVEVMRGEEVTLGIVFSPPPSPAKMLKRLQRYQIESRRETTELREDDIVRSFCSDYSDDSYIVLDGNTVDGQDAYMCAHSHPEMKSVSPVSRKVPARVRKKLETCLRQVMMEAEEKKGSIEGDASE